MDILEDIGMFSLDNTPVFDRVVEMARSILNCKVSLISLIDEPNDRQFFRAEEPRKQELPSQPA